MLLDPSFPSLDDRGIPIWQGSLDDGGNRGQWWPLLRMAKAKDGGYNSHVSERTGIAAL